MSYLIEFKERSMPEQFFFKCQWTAMLMGFGNSEGRECDSFSQAVSTRQAAMAEIRRLVCIVMVGS